MSSITVLSRTQRIIVDSNKSVSVINAGPIGPGGPPGIDGPPGADGPEGPQGPQGIQGVPGEDGSDGIDGLEGPQGIQGVPGEDGAEGPEGPQGIQGDEGPIGPEGPEGPQGPEGPEGPEGPQGPEGPEGIQGEEGPAGADGGSGDPTLWTPAEIDSAVMKLWLKPEDLPALGATVQTWPDSSGNGHDMSQATSGNRPVVVAGRNGSKASSFDGVDDFMATSAYACTKPESIFLFCKLRVNTGNAIPLINVSGSLRALRESYAAGLSAITDFGYEGLVMGIVGTTYHRLVTAHYNPLGSLVLIDDNVHGLSSGPGGIGTIWTNSNGMGIGGYSTSSSNSQIDILELIHIQGMPDPSLTRLIQDYFGRKYKAW